MRKRKKTLKRTAALMAAILMLNNTNMSVFALSVTQDEQTKMVTMTSAPETELPENDELFWYFAEEKLYGYEMATFGTRAREGLNDAEKAIYDELKSRIVTVANNGGSTVFEIDLSGISNLKTTWTNTDLKVDSISNSILNQVGDAFEAQFDFNSIIEALLDDCPFELYWYDKTGGARQNYSISGTSAAVSIINFNISFTVATEYKSGENMVTTDVSKVNTAKNNAQTVVNANASKSDYEKLVAYKEYICNAVAYNHDAANSNYEGDYGNPWQLIYVFDNDDNTNVVCEGYSKAFQYLCDIGGLDCISVSGTMDGGTGAGPHMWNVVTLGGKNYLVDVTNSDTGSIGSDGSLFLVGATYSNGGYIIGNVTYTCSDLSLATENYSVGANYSVTISDTSNGAVTVAKNTYAANENVVLTVTPAEGYKLETLVVKRGNETLNVTNNTFVMPEGDVTVTATFVIEDITAPTGEIQIMNDKWDNFFNWNSYNLFYKDKADVIVTATDADSDIAKVEYLIADEALSENEISSKNWTALTAKDGKYYFTIQAQNKGAVYVRITDAADNVTVINSQGIVVYTESAISEANFEYVYKENTERIVQVTMNGNTFAKLTDANDNVVSTENYTMDSSGKLILKAAYLDTLDKDEYIYKVYMNPQGEQTEEVTLVYTFTVNVNARELTVSKITAKDKDYDGKNAVEITSVDLVGVITGDTVSVNLTGLQGEVSSAKAGSYSLVTLPNLTLIGADAQNYTLKQPEGTLATNVTINKLDATINAGATSYEKIFGDVDFELDVTDNNPEADVTYSSSNEDVITISNGKCVIKGAGEAVITVSLAESENYNVATNVKISVKVEKADYPKNRPNSAMSVSNDCTKVSEITTLPEGWEWNEEDIERELKAGEAVTATAQYTKSDKNNYKNLEVEISITRAESTHTEGTTEEVTTEEPTTEDVTTEEPTTEDVTTEDVTTEDVTTEDVTTEDVTTEDVTTEDVTTEDVTTERVTTEEVTTEEVTTEDVTTEKVTTEEVTTEKVTTEDVTTEDVTTEDVTTEDVTTEEIITEDPTTEKPDVSEENNIEWKQDENGIFYEKEDGTRVKGWYEMEKGVWYYFDEKGYRQTGWEKDGKTWYYLNEAGVMQTGWLKDGETWYYLSVSGAMQTGWMKDNGSWYYLNADGSMKTGWVKDNGSWYYLNADGSMKTGWVKDNGSWYCLNADGSMKTGWVKDNGSWYYLNADGSMKTSWVRDNGIWYYLNADGSMKTGWIKDKDKWYYLDANGAMVTDTVIDGYKINHEGVWVK